MALVLVAPAGPASADPVCPPSDPSCWIHGEGGTTKPGGGGKPTGDPPPGKGGTGAPRVCKRGTEEVTCHDPDVGSFNSGDGCYYRLAEPQPDGVPAGHKAYVKTCANVAPIGVALPNPPGGFEQLRSPEQLAYDALALVTMLPPTIHLAPDPGGVGLVGLPVWMWTDRTDQIWGSQAESASSGPITVQITARTTGIVWNMGDGTSITCTSPGTPYAPRYGAQSSPDCGHTYLRSSRGGAGGRYPVTATSTWEVTWAGGGESGVITQTRESEPAAMIRIDELQVVTR
jgi:hypothetical protein